MSSRLPAIDNLLLRAQGAYEIEKKRREETKARWQNAAITVAIISIGAFMLWLWVYEQRQNLVNDEMQELDRKTYELEALATQLGQETEQLAFLVQETEALMRELVARDVARAGEIQQLRVLIVQGLDRPRGRP